MISQFFGLYSNLKFGVKMFTIEFDSIYAKQNVLITLCMTAEYTNAYEHFNITHFFNIKIQY